MNIRRHLYVLPLLLFAFGSIEAIAQPAHAKQAARAALPHIENFSVSPTDQFDAGTDLTFTVEGTPRGKASVRVTGIRRVIPLTEVERGIYEAEYTVSRRDRIAASSVMRATLTVRGQSTVVSQTLGSGAAAAPAAVAPKTGPLAIQRFTVVPISKIEPGAELKFSMAGAPGAKASFTIEGVVKDVPMQEVKSGQYEGSYTIRRLDKFPAGAAVTGTLEANGQVVRSSLNQALVARCQTPCYQKHRATRK
jgi:hypothetical protein